MKTVIKIIRVLTFVLALICAIGDLVKGNVTGSLLWVILLDLLVIENKLDDR